jgi:cold shock CspA family protein
MKEERVNGKMLWFNEDKGFGFIRTEYDERLYVARSGFATGEVPVGRCAGREVVFDREVREGDTRAVNVVFPPDSNPRRARPRQSHRGRSV